MNNKLRLIRPLIRTNGLLRSGPQKFYLNSFNRHFCSPSATFLATDIVAERVNTVLRNNELVDPSKITNSITFADLGLDSLDAVEVVMAFEEEFNIEIADEEADRILSVEDAIKYISSHPGAR